MTRLVGAMIALACAAFAVPANAEGIVPVSKIADAATGGSANWSGFYAGINGGKAWGNWDGTIETTAGCDGTCPSAGYDNPNHTLSGNGWVAGGQLGYNWRSGALVFGLEADLSWSDLDASGQYATDQYNPWVWDKGFRMSLDYFGTARARLGLATGPVLPFVTGGVAFGRTSGDLSVAQSHYAGKIDGVSYASTSENHLGWTAGGGVEWKLSNSLSLKAEYLYVDLGRQSYLFKGTTFTDAPFDTDSFPADLTFHVARIGLNYHFGN